MRVIHFVFVNMFFLALSLTAFETPDAIPLNNLDTNRYIVSYSEKNSDDLRIIIFTDNQMAFRICLYYENNGILSHRYTMEVDNHYYIPESGYEIGSKFNINYPFAIPEKDKLIASHDINNDGKLEYMIERYAPSGYSLGIYNIIESEIKLLVNVIGARYFYYDTHSGMYQIAGRYVSDYAVFSIEDQRSFYYYFVRNEENIEIRRRDFLSPVLYRRILNKLNNDFRADSQFFSFADTFKFQYANGYITDAVKWFKSNRRRITNFEGRDDYLREMELYYFIN